MRLRTLGFVCGTVTAAFATYLMMISFAVPTNVKETAIASGDVDSDAPNDLVSEPTDPSNAIVEEAPTRIFYSSVSAGRSNHAASIMCGTPSDNSSSHLMMAWFAGDEEGTPSTSIYLSTAASPDQFDIGALDHRHWKKPQRISESDEHSEQNPVLFRGEGDVDAGKVIVLYTRDKPFNVDVQATAEIYWRATSADSSTWEPARPLELAEPVKGLFLRHPPARTTDGRYLLPVYHCTESLGHYSAMLVSESVGGLWARINIPHAYGRVQASVVVQPTHFMAFFRSRFADRVYVSRSTDRSSLAGWSVPKPTKLPNNNSGVQVVATSNGTMLVVGNLVAAQKAPFFDDGEEVFADPARLPRWRAAKRDPISVAAVDTSDLAIRHGSQMDLSPSNDNDNFVASSAANGKSVSGPPDRVGAHEYSYPSVAVCGDDIHIAYSFNRDRIAVVHTTLSTLRRLEQDGKKWPTARN